MQSTNQSTPAAPSGHQQAPRFAVYTQLAVALAVWSAGVFRAAATPTLLDSAELASAAFSLGVAHPPGEALALLWSKAFMLLPLGTPAWRAAIGQCVASALAAVFVARVAVQVMATLDSTVTNPSAADRIQPGIRTRWLLAAGSALLFGLSPGALTNAARPEVYSLSAAVALAAFSSALAAFRSQDVRWGVLAAFLIGLGLTNHPLIAAAAGSGAVALCWPFLKQQMRAKQQVCGAKAQAAHGAAGRSDAGRPSPITRVRLVVSACAGLFAGLLVFVYLPLRTAALVVRGGFDSTNSILWGDARSLTGLWWILSGQAFLGKQTLVHSTTAPASLPFALVEELGLMGLALALLGAYRLFREHSRTVAVGLSLTVAVTLGGALFAGFDPSNPDSRGYLQPASALLCVAASVGLFAALALLQARLTASTTGTSKAGRTASTTGTSKAERSQEKANDEPQDKKAPPKAPPKTRRYAPLLTGSLAAVWALSALIQSQGPLTSGSLRYAWGADLAVTSLQQSLPPRAALLTGHFETAALLSYQRIVQGQRPDVAWGHLGFINQPGYADRLQRSENLLEPLLGQPAGTPTVGSRAATNTALGNATQGTMAQSVSGSGVITPQALAEISRHVPVFFEPFGHFDPRAAHQLAPCGALWCIPGPGHQAKSGWPSWLEAELTAEGAWHRQLFAYRLWHLYRDADFSCRLGRPEAAELLSELKTRAPDDKLVGRLDEDCNQAGRRGFNLLQR